MRSLRWFFIVLLVILTACAGAPRRPPGAVSELGKAEAARLVKIVEEKNDLITPYKGIGRIAVHGERGFLDSRAAWIAAPDGRFRVEALAVTGQPFARMICTRKECFFIFRDGDCLRRQGAGDTSLAPLSGIKLKARDMVRIMGGGAPLANYDSAGAYDTAEGGKVLVLKKRFSGTVQTIRFSEDLECIRETRVFGWRGLLYRAEIRRPDLAGSRMVPFDIDISDESGKRIKISVDRCWTDIEPKKKAFSPDLPEAAGCGRQ
ncbi:MAG: hypothetical protein K9J85_01310 [Desulfobacteraceae bacterium]|nr:hypothetical protein [Desulfobacteraceae bacterium]